MQAVINTRPNPIRALLLVVLVGAALIVAMLGGYVAGSRPGDSVTRTSIYQTSSGQPSAPLHGRFGGFQ
jgi:hypothetical protein